MNLFSDVETFNRACSVVLLPEPGWVSDDELALAVALVEEETRELVDALNTRDLVETADAIADRLYVTAGLALRIGGRNKVGPVDYLKDITHRKPSWDVYDEQFADEYPDMLARETRLLAKAVERRELDLTYARIRGVQASCGLLAGILALPLRSIWDEVQASNLAKLVDGKVIRHPQTGKVLKPEGWQPPDIAGVLARHGWRAAA